jgi:hypothetical protein
MILIDASALIFERYERHLIPEDRATPRNKKKKKGVKKTFFRHCRCLTLLALNLCLNHTLVYLLVGYVNRLFGGFIHTVFVAYPGVEAYADAYTYKRTRPKLRWSPWPAGIFRFNGKFGLMTVISSTDKDFADSSNIEYMRDLLERTDRIRRLLGAKQMTFAGIIPSQMYKFGLTNDTTTAKVTATAVTTAEADLRQHIGYPDNTPIILLGGNGFVGKRMQSLLASAGREFCVVDIDDQDEDVNLTYWPHHYKGKPAILINLTRKAALGNYISFFWPELVVLNEVYPEPSDDEIVLLADSQCSVYHIAGVKALSIPSFPRAYEGGIPCCAAWVNGDNNNDIDVIVRKMA